MTNVRRLRVVFTLVVVMDLVVAMLAIGMLNVDPEAAAAAGRSNAKVAIIVGPVGSLTPSYRRFADEAAAAAREQTDNVVTVYSPSATWTKVKAALKDASIVVYLGHGNGWPSPYRDSPYPSTQNGLGLNPVAGVDDEAHQYFGESFVSRAHLAPGAVVILGHLCYASGNPEPGGPEPSVEVARQRADNYAAGWMAAGAVAVIAEGHGSLDHYVRAVLRGRGTIEAAWRGAPTFHDHEIVSSSARTPGAVLTLDPDKAHRGFFRALTVLPGAKLADTLRGATTRPRQVVNDDPRTVAPTPDPLALASRGAHFGTPTVKGDPVAGSEVALTIPLDPATAKLLPNKVGIGTRWDELSPQVQIDPTTGGSSATVEPSADPGSPPGSDGPNEEPPAINLIDPERPGAEVAVHSARRGDNGLTVRVTVPDRPGLYRLVASIHDADGVAYDAETQDMIGALIVRVSGSVWATYGLQPTAVVQPGARFSLGVRVANTGTVPWSMPWSARNPLLVGRWVGLDDIATLSDDRWPTSADLVIIDAGASVVLDVAVTAPTRAGQYLLLFDIVDGDGTSLASVGVPPGMVRVTVQPVEQPSEDQR